MKNRNSWLISFLLLIIIILSSGCAFPINEHTTLNITNDDISLHNVDSNSIYQDLNKTFSKEGISFNYPTDWYTLPSWLDVIFTDDDDSEIGNLNPPVKEGGVVIQKYNLSTNEVSSVEEDFNNLVEALKNDNTTIIMQNTTTINGLKVYQMINSGKDPYYNYTQKMLYVETGKDQNIYVIQFFAESNSFDKYLPIFKQVVSTIKIE